MKKFGSKSGFTLVELIVVIAILGILAGIAVPAYSGYIKKANEAADYTQLDAIKTAAVFAFTDKQVKAEQYDNTDVKQIDVTEQKTITVTPVTGAAVTNLDISAYYDMSKFDFKSNTKSATWRKEAGTGENAPSAGWTLTPKDTTGKTDQGTGTPGGTQEKP